MKYLIIISLITSIWSCSKDATEETKTGTFMFHLHTYIDNEEVDLYNINYHTLEGRTISLNMAQLYITDVQLVGLDGSVFSFSGKKIIKVLEKATYEIGQVPVKRYISLRFKVGLDGLTDKLIPSTSSDSSILNRPEMWFSNSAQPDGYIYMNVQGKIDTSATLNKPPVPFAYKIGTNKNYIQITMPEKELVAEEGQILFGHIIIDYNKLFNGVDLRQVDNLSITTPSSNSSALASKIVNNIHSMFIYE
ncbi:MAG: hypothetical protein IPO25_14515 [Saprospiraceae bacterium]|nr:hypothetical protein [Saprospiraceae bacterium]